jgi:hypothetical protein
VGVMNKKKWFTGKAIRRFKKDLNARLEVYMAHSTGNMQNLVVMRLS